MLTYEQSVAGFTKLSYADKKKKVIAMLNILKEEGNIFQDLWDLLHINDEVSESIVDMIYQVITKAMYSLKEQEMEDAIDKLEKVKSKMSDLKSQESADKDDADSLLKNM